jgi:hypothetical protein
VAALGEQERISKFRGVVVRPGLKSRKTIAVLGVMALVLAGTGGLISAGVSGQVIPASVGGYVGQSGALPSPLPAPEPFVVPSSTSVAVGTTTTAGQGIWDPDPGVTWQWQLTGDVDTSGGFEVYGIDGFDNSADIVDSIHANGARAICYISGGSYEDWRPDAAQFPASVVAGSNGWEGENWLDVRQQADLLPIMEARVQMCAEKGFDAVEFDNVDGYSNDTGVEITAEDQISYNTALADLAHQNGLAAVLKNDAEQVAELEPYFDLAIVEQCYEYSECDSYLPFISAGKPVLITEYSESLATHCADAVSKQFSLIGKDLDLGAPIETC